MKQCKAAIASTAQQPGSLPSVGDQSESTELFQEASSEETVCRTWANTGQGRRRLNARAALRAAGHKDTGCAIESLPVLPVRRLRKKMQRASVNTKSRLATANAFDRGVMPKRGLDLSAPPHAKRLRAEDMPKVTRISSYQGKVFLGLSSVCVSERQSLLTLKFFP